VLKRTVTKYDLVMCVTFDFLRMQQGSHISDAELQDSNIKQCLNCNI
jgi:hypothetical protein